VTRSAAVLGPPTWSPDGRQLAVVAETDSGPRLMISDVATSTLTRAGTETASTHGMTAWSPDGRRLMYQLASYRNYGILDLETGTETRLVANDSVGWMFYPVYAPDGDHVVVQWHRPPSSGLWSISLKDGAQRELTSGNEIPLLWTGNGTIYFARFSGGLAGGGTIARMRAAGGRPSTVAAMPVSCTRGELSITPDARMAVCTVTTQASDVWIVENFDPKSR
jgi:dipeptidyl aminopeptidase/acylaminoacyl peptidase